MTQPQKDYILSLYRRLGIEGTMMKLPTTKSEASKLIDDLKSQLPEDE